MKKLFFIIIFMYRQKGAPLEGVRNIILCSPVHIWGNT